MIGFEPPGKRLVERTAAADRSESLEAKLAETLNERHQLRRRLEQIQDEAKRERLEYETTVAELNARLSQASLIDSQGPTADNTPERISPELEIELRIRALRQNLIEVDEREKEERHQKRLTTSSVTIMEPDRPTMTRIQDRDRIPSHDEPGQRVNQKSRRPGPSIANLSIAWETPRWSTNFRCRERYHAASSPGLGRPRLTRRIRADPEPATAARTRTGTPGLARGTRSPAGVFRSGGEREREPGTSSRAEDERNLRRPSADFPPRPSARRRRGASLWPSSRPIAARSRRPGSASSESG